MAAPTQSTTGPGAERTITLVDAVVAIAMTLLILPLVDVADELDVHDLNSFTVEYGNLLLTFVISFVVIYAFWGAHGTLYRRLRESQRDDVRWLSLLNLGWLLAIAFLPFPTALIGHDLNTTTGPIYGATLLVLDTLTLAITVLVHRSVGLPVGRAWLTTVVLAASFITSFFSPSAALYLLLLLIVLRFLEIGPIRRNISRRIRP